MPAGTPQLTVTVQPAAKPWWRSRTLWANALVLALAAAESRLGLLKDVLPVDLFQAVAFGLPVLNVWLRAVTSTAITAGAPAAPAAPATPPAPPADQEMAP